MYVLGIETSCDETALAIYHSERGLLAQKIYSQIELHGEYGGVVPELASRDHSRKIPVLMNELLQSSNLSLSNLQGIAFTCGPGLVGALLVGATFGRSLAYALNIPAVGVHHLEAHLLAPMLSEPAPAFPFLALLVSGGHTLLVEVQALGQYRLLGESVDDAVGEAFDKTAKLMGIPYPGGPEIEQLAEQGDPRAYPFPRPMCNHKGGLNFSLSGLKTAVGQALRENTDWESDRAHIAASFQQAIIDMLCYKCEAALKATQVERWVVAGGVSANRALRAALQSVADTTQTTVFFPPFEFCTDNAAMVAYAGCQRLLAGQADDLVLRIRPRWPLDSNDLKINNDSH